MSLVLTLLLDPAAQARFDAERAAYFPRARNHLAAHLTLFHRLPAEALPGVSAELRAAAGRHAPFPIEVHDLWLMGRGVAYRLRSPVLACLRQRLAAAWLARLTPQDRQPFCPHVTIQNKVDPATARALHAQLQGGFSPFQAWAEGFALWHYLGGPWRHAATYAFGA